MSRSLVSSAPEAPPTEPRHTEQQMPLAPAAQASPPHSSAPRAVKHCPVCRRTYPADERYYCTYHVAVLVEGAPPDAGESAPAPDESTPAPAASNRRPYLRWALGALALSAAIILGYSVLKQRSWWAGLLPAARPPAGGDYPLEVTTASIVGGALKGRQVSLPQPDYPAAARAQRVTGSVTVEVTADRAGRVIEARAVDGPEALRAAAEEAARTARFRARSSAVRTGTVRYDFMLCRDSGDCM